MTEPAPTTIDRDPTAARVPRHFGRDVAIEVAVAFAGVVLIGAAIAANQAWLDRHFLPSFFLPRQWYVLIETIVRVSLATIGLLLVFMRARIASVLASAAPYLVGAVLAAVLALGASELVLRRMLRSTEWLSSQEEPLRIPQARLGWVLAPGRTGHADVGGRHIDYAIDAAGYRVRRVDQPVDPARATIVFAGESMMFGEGLSWEESIPAQVGVLLGMPSANLAVHGYSNDQVYERLAEELPRFSRPVAVVTLFTTALFGRNLDRDRPHLGPQLTWLPAEPSSRLAALTHVIVPYRSDATVERGIAVTREVLRATVALATARGAASLILVPHFGAEDPVERALRLRLLDDSLPSLIVPIAADWRLPWDRHPNARADRVIATAVAEALRSRMAQAAGHLNVAGPR
jgi:hypothetical protein